uniref:Uncharacterized protein n=1 Tax=Ananas comosus var. bracteatus TaxID=296719 RepID=A0A6V7NNB9_ANACO|nr:unnamed protein product [Ananas comosus var. bracteatus]
MVAVFFSAAPDPKTLKQEKSAGVECRKCCDWEGKRRKKERKKEREREDAAVPGVHAAVPVAAADPFVHPPPVWTVAQDDELLLAMAESDLEEKLNEIRKTNSKLVVIGKTAVDYKEEIDAEAEDDDGDNVEESEGDEFEQETG